jgi:hypothetical protein
LGHQRAIAAGLVVALRDSAYDVIAIMDSDGEDRPTDLATLISTWRLHPGCAIVAKRGVRHEGVVFKVFNLAYRSIFKLVTGDEIDFGNFCLLPRPRAEALINSPATWNNLAASIVRSRMPVKRCAINRGLRLEGQSKMKFTSLVIHGLSAMSVFAETVLVRILLATLVFGLLAFCLLIVVIAIKLTTNLAIPGWASYVGGSLIIILTQAILIGGIAVFQLLSLRAMKPFIPASDVAPFIVDDGQSPPADKPSAGDPSK